jgi:hypothetical protein
VPEAKRENLRHPNQTESISSIINITLLKKREAVFITG